MTAVCERSSLRFELQRYGERWWSEDHGHHVPSSKYSKWDVEVLDFKRFEFVLLKRPNVVPPRSL